MNQNYRGTGKTKAECQAMVDKAVEQFKIDYPGKEVPSQLLRWVDNLPTAKDIEVARQRQRRSLD